MNITVIMCFVVETYETGSRFESWLLSAYRAFNNEHNIFTHVCGYTLHIDEMARLYDFSFLEKVFQVAHKLKREHLSVEEESVLKGLVILSGGVYVCVCER